METFVVPTPLRDVCIIEIKYFRDERGFFIENYHQRDFAKAGLQLNFVQDNHSRSGAKVLRGLHYQDLMSPLTCGSAPRHSANGSGSSCPRKI